jgi:hypothetical protein
MVFGQQQIGQELETEEGKVENVNDFEYLGMGCLITWDNDCTVEIKRRIGKATGVMAGFRIYGVATASVWLQSWKC